MTKIETTQIVLIEIKISVCSSPVKILCRTKKSIVKEIIGKPLPISVRWPAEGHPLPQGKDWEKFLNLTDQQIMIQIFLVLQLAQSFS